MLLKLDCRLVLIVSSRPPAWVYWVTKILSCVAMPFGPEGNFATESTLAVSALPKVVELVLKVPCVLAVMPGAARGFGPLARTEVTFPSIFVHLFLDDHSALFAS